VVIVMAVHARRFIPLAIALLAPMIALRLEWMLRAIGRAWVVAALAAALVVPSAFLYRTLWRHYSGHNPFLPAHSVLQRMISYNKFPPGPADFINSNDISGRVLNEWRWEGYLRWRCPQLKLFTGGRAQQVYRLETYDTFMHIIDQGDPSGLTRSGISLAVIPYERKYSKLIGAMTARPASRWAPIYADRRNMVLANADLPATRQLIDKAAAGQLAYPNAGIAALSRAMCLSAKCVRAPKNSRDSALMEAGRLMPTTWVYLTLAGPEPLTGKEARKRVDYLQKEFDRLGALPTDRPEGAQILACRLALAESLARKFQQAGDRRQALRWSQAASDVERSLLELKKQWD